MIKDGKTVSDEVEYNIKELFLKNDISKIDIQSTIEFSADLNLEFPKFSYELPRYSENSDELLKSLCKKGLRKRLNGNVPVKYVDRLKYEISVIERMGYTDYFLIVYDFILYAKKNNIIVGPGRGSGAGSLVCYALGIIELSGWADHDSKAYVEASLNVGYQAFKLYGSDLIKTVKLTNELKKYPNSTEFIDVQRKTYNDRSTKHPEGCMGQFVKDLLGK